MGEESFVARSGYRGGLCASVWRPQRSSGWRGQWAEEGGEPCPVSSRCCFSWPSVHITNGVCAELSLSPGSGQSQGGPLLFQREEAHGHFRHWQAWVPGCLCCTGFAGKAFRLPGDPGYAGPSKPQGIPIQPSRARYV